MSEDLRVYTKDQIKATGRAIAREAFKQITEVFDEDPGSIEPPIQMALSAIENISIADATLLAEVISVEWEILLVGLRTRRPVDSKCKFEYGT